MAVDLDGINDEIVSWKDWRTQEPANVRALADAVLQHFNRDNAYATSVRSALGIIISDVARIMERDCTSVVFSKAKMMIEGEASSQQCAERILQMIPLYHILIGGSFAMRIVDERRAALAQYGMTDIDYWLVIAKEKIVGLLSEQTGGTSNID